MTAGADDGFQAFVLDQLSGLPGVRCRRMFGGFGLYRGEAFFGIIFRGRLYFKTDAASRGDYQRRGMAPFKPNARQTLTSYFETPPDILEESEQLIAWAQRAIHAQSGRSPQHRTASRGGKRA